eukprot:CAMPEP_0174919050 /NCGR_PEP_ID=MMETSP1355-20121228/3444_1 /TAXON_ID=464990 /ORGANISM="Hemiselmis tepida, Strain CCMP443" /LENGTH=31 /DNA_ID= /DNA_START= /DNA_END= /DNA_ORIENTATION=
MVAGVATGSPDAADPSRADDAASAALTATWP